MQRDNTRTNEATRISRRSILINALLSAGKLAAGILANSAAMVSDAIHSASDVLSTLMVLISLRMAGRSADTDHPYGHDRLESIAGMLLGMLLAATAIGVGWSGVTHLLHPDDLPMPGVLALIAAAVSIVVKEGMYRATRRTAEKVQSPALMADAWHHRSDALSSLGSLAGIAAARLGFPLGDPIASLLIAVMILKAAYDVFKEAAAQVTDRACSTDVENAMRSVILQVPGVKAIDLLHTRQFGARVYTDVEIAVDGTLTLRAAHDIAERVHARIEAEFPAVKHCMVHVNPAEHT